MSDDDINPMFAAAFGDKLPPAPRRRKIADRSIEEQLLIEIIAARTQQMAFNVMFAQALTEIAAGKNITATMQEVGRLFEEQTAELQSLLDDLKRSGRPNG